MAKERRGFAGFDSMVSDLSDLPPPPSLASSALPSPPPSPPSPSPPNLTSAPVTKSNEGRSLNSDPVPTSAKAGVVVMAAFALGALVLATNVYKQNRREDLSGFLPRPAATSLTNASVPSATATRQYSPATSEVNVEEKPPVGEDLVLSTAQLRYCLAQGARIDGGQKAVNTRSEIEVNRFNALVEDYNARCIKFRYYTNAMRAVKADVEARRRELEAEGVALVGSSYSR